MRYMAIALAAGSVIVLFLVGFITVSQTKKNSIATWPIAIIYAINCVRSFPLQNSFGA